MSESFLAPVEIFKAYHAKKINIDLAIDSLILYIDYGLNDQGAVALNFLGQLPQNSKVFSYLADLMISDTDNYLRALSIEIAVKKYFDEIKKALDWMITNETFIKVLVKLYWTLDCIQNDTTDFFKGKVLNRVAELFNIFPEEGMFILELFSKEGLFDYDLCINSKFLKRWVSSELSDYVHGSIEKPLFIINYYHIICVNLFGFKLKKLPSSIGALSQLAILDLSENELVDLPEEVGLLHNLKKLFLDWNKFSTLPDCCGNLSNLRELHIKSNFQTFKKVSEAMWKIAQFCYIQKYIYEGVVPSEAPVLSLFEMMVGGEIEKLDYAHDNYDKELSCFYYGSGAGYLYSTNSAGNVTGIYIHGNMEIRDTICIPKYIYHLKFLRELSMIGCFIHKIPETLGQLTFLKRVNLESNSIKSIPKSMKLLPNLIYLKLSWNSVSKQLKKLKNHNFLSKNLVIDL